MKHHMVLNRVFELSILFLTCACANRAFAEAQYIKLPPGARGSAQNSVLGKSDFDASLSSAIKEDMLKSDLSEEISNDTQVIQTISTGDKKHKSNNLGIGEFRTKELTDGFIQAPGISDFAAYFRATSPTYKGATNIAKSFKPGAMDEEELKRQGVAETLRVQTAESIKKILLAKPSAAQRLDLLMRLSEIQIERQAYALEVEIKTFNDSHDAWKNTNKGLEPVFKTSQSDAQLLVGIDTLRAVVNEYPNHERTPEALFALGFLLTQIQSENAVLYFDKLVKRFPKSSFVPDSHLALGEYYFARHKFDKAKEEYQKILIYKNTSSYNYAVYKLGWTYFNLRSGDDDNVRKNLNKSLSAFKLLVKLSESNKQDNILQALRKDAMRDIVLVFVDLNDIVGAQAYFESLGEPDLYFTMLERLAWQYSEKGNYVLSIEIYQRLISEGALQVRLPIFYSKIPELYEKQGQIDKLLENLGNMASALSLSSPWMKKFAQNKTAQEYRQQYLGKELRAWADKFHIEAQSKKIARRYNDALIAYTLYLEHFGNIKESYGAHFFRGEILVSKARYSEAADEYMKAAQLDEKFVIKGKYTATALINAMACIDKIIEKTSPPQLPALGKAEAKIPLPDLHARLVLAIDTFLRMFPSNSQVLEFAHRAARTFYVFGDYSIARERWITLAQRFPKSREVNDGLKLSMKVWVERKAWDNAIADCRSYLAITGVKATGLEKSIVAVLKGSIFSKALLLEKQEQRNQAAELFLAYHKEFDEDVDAPKALFNAANNRFKEGKIDDAIATLRIILAQYPKSNLIQDVHYLIGSSYDALGVFNESAASYEQLVLDAPKNPAAPDALLRAAEERLSTGEYEIALRDALKYQVIYPNLSRVGEAYYFAGKAHLKLHNSLEAMKSFSAGADKLAAYKPAFAVFLYGQAIKSAASLQNNKKMEQFSKSGVAVWHKLAEADKDSFAWEGIRDIAQFQVDMLDARLPILKAKTITDGLQLVPQFTKIRDEATSLSASYTSVAKLGNAESAVACLYRIAEIQEYLANTLLKTPIPKGASLDEIEKFKGNIEKVALPLQEESANLYYIAWQKGNDSESLTDFQSKLYAKLATLRPNEFKQVIQDLPTSAYYNSDISLVTETMRLAKE